MDSFQTNLCNAFWIDNTSMFDFLSMIVDDQESQQILPIENTQH